ncbi:phosphopantetheine-binding protein [Streptomyces sp. AC154]|uniref:phosphopantetheine-binding protein n=1 Tax=Streptomyces sp. AC154 TaxID=3143184 RepID=UPI003F806CFC
MTTAEALSRQEIREAVAAVLRLPADSIADDTNLVQLGLKSLHLMQLINGWRRAGHPVKLRDLAAVPTIEAWAGHLAGHAAAPH